jgi:hypothetical protein
LGRDGFTVADNVTVALLVQVEARLGKEDDVLAVKLPAQQGTTCHWRVRRSPSGRPVRPRKRMRPGRGSFEENVTTEVERREMARRTVIAEYSQE